MDPIDELLFDIPIPRMIKVRQTFDRTKCDKVDATLGMLISQNAGFATVEPGMKVAITAGSRGITNQPLCIRTIVALLRQRGAEPFIVPAMGSHGGASAKGQKEMLIGMGITEEYTGAPIISSMETVNIGTSENGLPVVIDKNAYGADGIVIINRIKPHVAFRGPYESGLMKMLAIGLGKQHGADICHELGFGKMAVNIPAIARVMIEKLNILFAVGLIENAYHETHSVHVLNKTEIEAREPALQELAKAQCPKLHIDKLDVLIMDEIGKDISGTGFDTGVVGRYHTPYISGGPTISKMSVLDLTERSHGNANGIGIVDFTTKRLADKFLPEQTYPNALTSTVPLSVKLPMVLKNDKQAVQAAIKTCNILDKPDVRLMRIRNTVSLDLIEVSENLRDEVDTCEYLEVVSEPFSWVFDDKDNLL
jgi:hypothetical protein